MENKYDTDDALINNHAALIEDAVDLIWHFYDKCFEQARERFAHNYSDNMKRQEIAMMAAVAALQDYKQEVKEMMGY